MVDQREIFLNRLHQYRIQYLAGVIIAPIVWYLGFLFFVIVIGREGNEEICRSYMTATPIYISIFYNVVTYYYSAWMARKYGIEMFGDLDQKWLREHQAFDAKDFGDIFARTIQSRRMAIISGLWMIPFTLIHYGLSIVLVLIYFAWNIIYRETYLDDAVSYKVPRAFGGGGEVISKIIDEEFTNEIKELNKNIKELNKK